jgi:iron complex outermembrane receptor protein
VCLPLFAVAVAGQQHPVDLSEMSLEDLANVQVYSASKHVQSTREAPALVTIVTADEIRKYGYRTLSDLLHNVGDFYVTYDRNYSYLGVRGLARPGDYNTRILCLIDGHRLNDAIYDQAPVGTEFPLDVDLIERVEIVRGPSSSLYGTSAFFAVVNIITRKGKDLHPLELSAEAAGFGAYKGRFTFGSMLRDWRVLFSGSFYESRGQMLYFREFDAPETNGGWTVGTDDDGDRDFLLKAARGRLSIQALYGSREKGIPTGSYSTVFNDPRNRTLDTRGYVALGYERQAGRWAGALRLSYDRSYYLGGYVFCGDDSCQTTVLNKDFAKADWWSGELDLSRALAKHRLTGGLELRHNLHQSQGNYDLETAQVYFLDKRSSTIGALYLQDEYAILSSLILSAGLRHDHYNSFGGTTNPRLGLIFMPRERTTLKLLYGTAFRAPNAFEMFYAGVGYKASPGLRPERIRNMELVWEQGLGRYLHLAGSLFHNRIGGLISQHTDPADGLIVYRNTEGVSSHGLHIQLDGRLRSGLEGKFGYTFQQVEDRVSHQPLTNSPKHMAKLNLSVPLWRERLFASIGGKYVARRKTLGGSHVGGHTNLDLTLLARRLGRGLDLSATVYNLLDKGYADPAGEEHLQDSIAQDGRSFRAKFVYRF